MSSVLRDQWNAVSQEGDAAIRDRIWKRVERKLGWRRAGRVFRYAVLSSMAVAACLAVGYFAGLRSLPEPEPAVEEPTPEPEPEPVVEEPTPEPEPEPVVEEPATEPEEEEPSFTFELPEFSSLDDYLDYAYEEKDAGNTAVAAAAYQKAIDSFPDDPYLPFLVIELGNLYKEAGAYDVAVSTYRDALSLPVIQGQNGIVDEFKKNIAYLEAVSHITSRHDAPETPFSQIPPDWLAEIEEAFAQQAEH